MIKIISDSTCDLSEELIKRYDVEVIPLHIILDEESYEDGRDITPDQIYRWADEHKSVPKTAACSQEKVKKRMQKYLRDGIEMICFNISATMSSTHNVFLNAVEELNAGNMVSVIDSENLSTGVGLQVIAAAEMAGKGMDRLAIVQEIEKMKKRVSASFVVDTLTYLHRGGRCSGVSALLGTTLKLHPQIDVIDGKMQPGKKFRGKMHKVVADYVEEKQDELKRAVKNHVFVTHSGCDEKVLDAALEKVRRLNYFDEIHVTRAGGVISSHCGYGTLGVLYVRGE